MVETAIRDRITVEIDSWNWNLIPYHMREGVRLYIEHGVMTGSFQTALMSNDLRGACEAADDINRHCLFDYCRFLYCDAPSECWGSPGKVSAWMARGGMRGNMSAALGEKKEA